MTDKTVPVFVTTDDGDRIQVAWATPEIGGVRRLNFLEEYNNTSFPQDLEFGDTAEVPFETTLDPEETQAAPRTFEEANEPFVDLEGDVLTPEEIHNIEVESDIVVSPTPSIELTEPQYPEEVVPETPAPEDAEAPVSGEATETPVEDVTPEAPAEEVTTPEETPVEEGWTEETPVSEFEPEVVEEVPVSEAEPALPAEPVEVSPDPAPAAEPVDNVPTPVEVDGTVGTDAEASVSEASENPTPVVDENGNVDEANDNSTNAEPAEGAVAEPNPVEGTNQA